jgi:zinc resistance-associated protein
MKKLLIVLITVVAVGSVASLTLACMWDGYGGNARGDYSRGYGPDVYAGGAYQGFLNDTATLRQELAAKQGEYRALMARPNPDSNRAGQLSREIGGMHNRLHAMARTGGFGDWCPYEYGGNNQYWACW